MTYPRHGEELPNGFHVGDLVTYTSHGSTRYGVLVPTPERWARRDRGEPSGRQAKWSARWSNTEFGARRGYDEYDPENCDESYTTRDATLVSTYDGVRVAGTITSTEGSTTMSVTVNGEMLSADMQPEEIVEGQEYRVIYTRDYHNFEFIGRARQTCTLGQSISMEIVRWVRENGSWNEQQYPVGYVWGVSSNTRTTTDPQNLILPAAPPAPPEPTDSTFDEQAGEFLPHNGEVPTSGAIVRGMNTDTREVEGLFLRMDGEEEATIEAKRRRTVRANGTRGEWEVYENTSRRNIRVAGATIFKPGATPADMPEIFYERVSDPIEDRGASLTPGEVVSAVGYSQSDYVFRGTFLRTVGTDGRVRIMATHRSRMDTYSTDGIYSWVKLGTPTEVTAWMDRSEARQRWNRAGYRWTPLAPGVKPVDPAFDPKRKTPNSGMGIGDMVVGVMSTSRDTVSNWVRGEIVKWRGSNPVVRVTDKMESSKKVGAEVEVISGDTYPALADPKGADPEAFKNTLRMYLIGRHKHGDFCQGGLNTMLSAFGIPLYEKRRRATLVVSVDYDPNSTDMYEVQRQLQSGMAGVSGISIGERDGADFEVEADVTAG